MNQKMNEIKENVNGEMNEKIEKIKNELNRLIEKNGFFELQLKNKDLIGGTNYEIFEFENDFYIGMRSFDQKIYAIGSHPNTQRMYAIIKIKHIRYILPSFFHVY